MKIINKSIPNKIVKTVLLFCLIFTSFFSLSTTAESQVNPDRTNGAQAATLDWIRNTALEIVSLYMARSWHGDFPDEVPSWRPTEVQDTDGQIRLDTRQRLIRWDRRPPNEILRDGFVPQVTTSNPSLNETDLYSYAKSNVKSFFVSTTKTQFKKNRKYVWTPRSAASGIVYQYEIFAPGGVDVNESLGEQSPWPGQCKVAFPGGIRPEYIRSVREMSGNRLVRIWRNPNFSDPGELPEIASRASTEQLMWYENHPQGGNKDLNKSITGPDSDMKGSDGNVLEDTLVYEKHDQILPDGEYKIGSRLNPNVIVDLSGGSLSVVHAWNYLGLDNQKWQFTYDNEKRAYKITSSKDSNLALTWYTRSNSVSGFIYTGQDSQFWRIETAKDGDYKIRNLSNPRMVLDLTGGATSNGTPIQVYEEKEDSKATDNQEWDLSMVDEPIISDGEYKISTKINYKKVIDFYESNHNIMIWDNMNIITSYWILEYDLEKKHTKYIQKNTKMLDCIFKILILRLK